MYTKVITTHRAFRLYKNIHDIKCISESIENNICDQKS